MEIEEFRAVIRAHDFDRTCRFYGETLALARSASWQSTEQGVQGAVFQAGSGAIEVLGRLNGGGGRGRDEAFDAEGPDQKVVLELTVPSAQQAYDDIIFRNRNIPGGLRKLPDGRLVFETHDPDGVKLVFAEPRQAR